MSPWSAPPRILAFIVEPAVIRTILAHLDRGRVRIWTLPEATERLAFEAHSGQIHAVAPSPDRTTFATGGEDRAVRIWRAADGSLVRELADQAGPKTAAAATVSAAAASRAAPLAPTRPPAGLVITGRLVTASGEPVARRNLKLPLAYSDEKGGLFYSFAPDFYEATSGNDGRFRFVGVKSGARYAVVDMSSGRPAPLKRSDGSTVLLQIAKGAANVDLGEIRFMEP
ncbi:MAG TPA: hypothetical protein VMT16_00455 [Thermoanaerobaculia bacterium]|nr:hypothetical protein [Thermoanaerobaculia bacterium]